MRKIHIPVFRIFYSTTYTFLLILTLLLFAIVPVDHIYQTLRDGRYGNVFVVSGVYLVTAIIAAFIYASRLYTNRTILAGIPRSYLPIEDGEVGRNIRRVIVANRQRSAMIALSSRPRDRAAETVRRPNTATTHLSSSSQTDAALLAPPDLSRPPPWGIVSHPGWSSPSNPSIPHLDFSTVIAELPALLEAKAVSLSPPSHAFDFLASTAGISAPPDPVAVATLQRQPEASLREYLADLTSLGVLRCEDEVVLDFVQRYENARFSGQAVTEREFEALMERFATVMSAVEVDDEEVLGLLEAAESQRAASETGSVRRLGLKRAASRASMASFVSTGSVVRHGIT
jgi:hypothetical protein